MEWNINKFLYFCSITQIVYGYSFSRSVVPTIYVLSRNKSDKIKHLHVIKLNIIVKRIIVIGSKGGYGGHQGISFLLID